jgi:hypothetical protein
MSESNTKTDARKGPNQLTGVEDKNTLISAALGTIIGAQFLFCGSTGLGSRP